ncbi:MAG: hypothetical protein ABSH20_26155 [Tepidisphaeraceae bacterium]
MQVGIYHNINDVQKWEQTKKSVMSKIEGGTLPAGLKPVLFIPGTNHKMTFCVWEADSIDAVRKFIDKESGTAARNEYFEVDTEHAMGLPEAAHAAS